MNMPEKVVVNRDTNGDLWVYDYEIVGDPIMDGSSAVYLHSDLIPMIFNDGDRIALHILRNWDRERIVSFAKHLLGDVCQSCPLPEGD